MRKKVVVAGNICLDITPVFPQGKVNNVGDLLKPGKLIEMGNVDVHTGGAVANTGLGMKILGADVSLMGKVGKDAFGEMIINILNQYEAGNDMIVSDDESSSYSVVLAMPGIDRIFLHSPGVNNTLGADEIKDEALKDAALLHFGYPPLMQKFYENGCAELVKLFKRAKSFGILTSLDMAAVDPTSKAGKEDWYQVLVDVLPYVDFFVPSFEELCFMLDREKYEALVKEAGHGDMTEILDVKKDIKPLADKCVSLGAKVVLIKCGAPGLYYKTSDETSLEEIKNMLEIPVKEWCNSEGFEKSFKPERVLSATGAGDTCIAAFLVSALDGCTLKESVELAAATGACCVSEYDALSGLQPLYKLKEKIDAGWEKV